MNNRTIQCGQPFSPQRNLNKSVDLRTTSNITSPNGAKNKTPMFYMKVDKPKSPVYNLNRSSNIGLSQINETLDINDFSDCRSFKSILSDQPRHYTRNSEIHSKKKVICNS